MDQVPMDTISLNFEVEEWMNSETAEVTIIVDASLENTDGFELKLTINSALEKIIPGVVWRYSQVNRSRDRTGRETWQLGIQARVTDEILDGISVRARNLGMPGLQFRIGNVDYTPTAEAVQELNRTLRSKLNAMITAELEMLNSELTGRTWRVSNVHYGNHMDSSNFRASSSSQILVAAAGMATQHYDESDSSDDEDGAGGFDVSQKVTLTANVVISSTVAGFESA